MRLLMDTLLNYRGYHGCSSRCGVHVWEPTQPGEPYVAIYTELADTPGTRL